MIENTSWTIDVQTDSDGEKFIQLNDAIIAGTGWQVGDEIEWTDNGDGSWTMSKKQETELVLVEAISTFKHQYVVEVPKGKAEWALDDVTMESVDEMSQQHLGQQIFSYRTITKEEYIKEFDKNNDYLAGWDEEQKMRFIKRGE